MSLKQMKVTIKKGNSVSVSDPLIHIEIVFE